MMPRAFPALPAYLSSRVTCPHIELLEASFVVKLGLTSDLNVTQVSAFQMAAADWIAMQASLSQ
jgi:hypothetical protein